MYLGGSSKGDKEVSLGARGDSYYEYLLKQWLLTDRQEDSQFLFDYRKSINGIRKYLTGKANGYTYIGEWTSTKDLSPKMDHLVW